ncbi:hypothetical protein D3C76_1386180 [compost metagenome]
MLHICVGTIKAELVTLPIQRNHRGLQRILAVADAVFVDHIPVCAQVKVLGKLAQKLVVDR